MTPAELFGGFAGQLATVLPWVGAGIAAAIGLFFVLLGIRNGLSWFITIVAGRNLDRYHASKAGITNDTASQLFRDVYDGARNSGSGHADALGIASAAERSFRADPRL